jgi:hypothetical protein
MSDRNERETVSWGTLPDPRDPRAPEGRACSVRFDEKALRHIVGKHIGARNELRQPWDDWLSSEVIDDLLDHVHSNAGKFSGDWREVSDRIAAPIEDAARASLARPLTLFYDSGDTGRETWLLVLPSGALMVIHGGRRPRVATCYCPGAAARESNPSRRWIKTVSRLVAIYAVMKPNVGLVPPMSDSILRLSPDKRGDGPVRTHVRFVTPASWGFRTELAGTPWGGRPEPWEAAPADRPRSRRRLLKSRRTFEGSEAHV